MRVVPLATLALVILLVFAATGCGPIMSTYLIVDAEAKLAAAEAAEAETYAVYEYTAASAYLQKAHEELGYADYGPAIDYAFKAADMASRGTARAVDEKSKHIDQPGPDPTAPLAVPASAAGSAAKPGGRKVIIKKLETPAGQNNPTDPQ
jgi:hypothetical protein